MAALEWLADELGAPKSCRLPESGSSRSSCAARSSPKRSALTLAALLPENCIVVEDAVTSGRALFRADVRRGAA